MTLRPAASFRRRIAHFRGDETAILEPVESRVDGSEQDASPGGLLDFTRDRDAVRVVQPQNRQQNHQLELGEDRPCHFFTCYEYISNLSTTTGVPTSINGESRNQ